MTQEHLSGLLQMARWEGEGISHAAQATSLQLSHALTLERTFTQSQLYGAIEVKCRDCSPEWCNQ